MTCGCKLNAHKSIVGKDNKTVYQYDNIKFKNAVRKSKFNIPFYDGNSNMLFDKDGTYVSDLGSVNYVGTSHNIKAHNPERKKDISTSKDLISNFFRPLTNLGSPSLSFPKYFLKISSENSNALNSFPLIIFPQSLAINLLIDCF